MKNLESIILGALVALGLLVVAVLAFREVAIPGLVETVVTVCVGGLVGATIPRTRGGAS